MRLTIVIPTLNRAYCIGRAIDSALAQTASDIEVVVSNNGSTDGTREIISRYRDPRLRVFHHATTMPVYDHANFLLNAARGAVFVGLSDDDYLEPTFAERALAVFDRHPDVSFVYSRCWTHVGEMAMPSPAGPELEPTREFFSQYFAGNRHIFWCACATRTDDLRQIGPLPRGTQIGDMYYWTQLAMRGPVGCVPELLAHYTYLVDNASVGIPACVWAEETSQLIERLVDRLREAQVPPEELNLLRRRMDSYLARTTANQLSLNVARGASKGSVLTSLRSCGHFLRGDLAVAVPRVCAALLLPSPTMAKLVRSFVSKRSRWARGGEPARLSASSRAGAR